MTMMISKFHKLIQSKVVWYIIIGVIVISFGLFGAYSFIGQGSNKPVQEPVGELYGEKVMPQEYWPAYDNARLWDVLSSGQMPQMTDEKVAMLRQEAWLRVAARRKAVAEKIEVTDEEVVKQIQQLPTFQGESGGFDHRAYNMILKHLGTSSTQVEALIREQILLHKLMTRPVQAALISPQELLQAYHLYTDRFVLKTAMLPRDRVGKGIVVSREEAEVLFAENKEAFRMPAKVRVSYVEWAVSDFIEKAEIPEGTALQAYNQNLEAYRIETTNDAILAEYKPFEEVEAEITAQLLRVFARRLAAEEATALVATIAPKSEKDLPDFAGGSAAAGLTIKTLPAFGLNDALKGIDETAPFRQAASRLQDDVYSSFSDAVIGKHSVYVLSLEKRYASFLPDFEVVEANVMEAARAQAVAKALSARAVELQETWSAALLAGSSFEAVMSPYKLKIETTEEFDLTTPLTNNYANILVPICLNTQKGELCQLVPVEEGILIAYVAERQSTDAEVGLPAIRQELVEGLSQNRARQLADDWQAMLLKEANFKNLMEK